MAFLALSENNWTVPIDNGFLVGSRATIMRKVRGGRELALFMEKAKELLGNSQMSEKEFKQTLQQFYPLAYVEEGIRHLLNLGVLIFREEMSSQSFPENKLDGERDSPATSTRRYLRDHFDEKENAYGKLRSSRVAVIGKGRLVSKVIASLADLSPQSIRWIVEDDEATRQTADQPLSKNSVRQTFSDQESLGVAIEDQDFIVAVADDPIERLRLFPKVNAANLNGVQKPWLCCYTDGHQIFAGPMFVPGETGCYRCLELREENHLPYPEEFASFKNALANNKIHCESDAPDPALQVASGFVSAEVMKALARVGFPATFQTLVVIDLNLLETERHRLLRVPFCDVCGTHLKQPFRKTWDM
ncbi:MAG: TOMM precursor leader peptide-binding protein [Magnetococcales bacterium]|nr:TOMM precursor leader peptide-binding protein [Magnetococcales bacterium]